MVNAWTWVCRNDRWIPALIVAGFLVTIAVNAIMVWFALGTWTGLTTDRAYREGLAYNVSLHEAQTTAALGWTVDLDIAAEGSGQIAELTIADADGSPVDGATVLGLFVRPTHEGYDFDVAFRQVAAGRYVAEFIAPLPGQWDLRFEIDRGGNVYRDVRRVKIQP